METIQDLRRICQMSRESVDSWYGKKVIRKFSIYITKMLIPLGLTANAVTFIFMLVGLASCVLMAVPSVWSRIAAVISLHVWYLLDHVDGEVARYRKEPSLTGIFFDGFLHYLIQPLIFICLGAGEYLKTGKMIFVFLGLISGAAVIYIPLLGLLETMVMDRKSRPVAGSSASKPSGKISLPRRVFSWVSKSFTCPTFIMILTVILVADVFVKMDLAMLALYYYAAAGTLVWAAIFFVKIATRDLDKKGTYVNE